MQPNQMAHCIRDPDILDMVGKAQLKLVLIDRFPEIFTWCPRAEDTEAHAIRSTVDAGEEVGRKLGLGKDLGQY